MPAAFQPFTVEGAYHVRVLGPDCGPPRGADLCRLFPGDRLTTDRRQRLHEGSRIVISWADRIVAVGAYRFNDRELRITDIGLDVDSACGTDEVLGVLLESCELACLAAGCRRVVLIAPREASLASLRRRGYEIVRESCAGSWIEKQF